VSVKDAGTHAAGRNPRVRNPIAWPHTRLGVGNDGVAQPTANFEGFSLVSLADIGFAAQDTGTLPCGGLNAGERPLAPAMAAGPYSEDVLALPAISAQPAPAHATPPLVPSELSGNLYLAQPGSYSRSISAFSSVGCRGLVRGGTYRSAWHVNSMIGAAVSQAKGVLPTKEDDRQVLYKNPRACGYFIGVQLAAEITRDQIATWLAAVDGAIAALVKRESPADGRSKGDKVASIAVGFGARPLLTIVGDDDPSRNVPVGMRRGDQPPGGWLPSTISPLNADVLFYVMSVYETRVNEFLATVVDSPIVASINLERGYQRSDASEPFGYRDGLRNVAPSDRSRVVYVHCEGGQPDEPTWANGGTYMVLIKILQNPTAFEQLPDDKSRDAVIGRTKTGVRLDLVDHPVDPHHEPSEYEVGEPPNAHVRKAGPRGRHDDNQIFRRGLPFMEVNEGRLDAGLQFCSFQANPAQFDSVFNDWLMNPLFPPAADATSPGVDALLDQTRGFTEFKHGGVFFVPSYDPDGLLASLTPRASKEKPTAARLAITKFVLDANGTAARVERGGFGFQVQHEDGTAVAGSDFLTASSGRGVCPVELQVDRTYRLVETVVPPGVSVATAPQIEFVVDKPNLHLTVENRIQEQPAVYGG
jgi:Dyp-type peroxidase family